MGFLHRLLTDFWPLDNSNVGPNLIASAVITAGVILHNEYRVIRRDEKRHASMHQIVHDAVHQALHPVDVAEDAIADKVRKPK